MFRRRQTQSAAWWAPDLRSAERLTSDGNLGTQCERGKVKLNIHVNLQPARDSTCTRDLEMLAHSHYIKACI